MTVLLVVYQSIFNIDITVDIIVVSAAHLYVSLYRYLLLFFWLQPSLLLFLPWLLHTKQVRNCFLFVSHIQLNVGYRQNKKYKFCKHSIFSQDHNESFFETCFQTKHLVRLWRMCHFADVNRNCFRWACQTRVLKRSWLPFFISFHHGTSKSLGSLSLPMKILIFGKFYPRSSKIHLLYVG